MDAQFEAWKQKALAVPFERILNEHTNLKLTGCGMKLKGPCPHCGGEDRFAIDLSKPAFNCRGCGSKGRDSIALTRFLKGVDFKTAVEILTGEPPPEQGNGKAQPVKKVVTPASTIRMKPGKSSIGSSVPSTDTWMARPSSAKTAKAKRLLAVPARSRPAG